TSSATRPGYPTSSRSWRCATPWPSTPGSCRCRRSSSGSPAPARTVSFSPPERAPLSSSDCHLQPGGSVMIESHVDVGGAVVFLSLSDGTDRERLRAGFTPLGLAFHVPEPRPPSAALRDALEDILGGPRVLIRPLADRDGFVVVREDRGQEQNAYTTELVA